MSGLCARYPGLYVSSGLRSYKIPVEIHRIPRSGFGKNLPEKVFARFLFEKKSSPPILVEKKVPLFFWKFFYENIFIYSLYVSQWTHPSHLTQHFWTVYVSSELIYRVPLSGFGFLFESEIFKFFSKKV